MFRFALALILLINIPAIAGEWDTCIYGYQEFVGLSETDLVPEASGVIASRISRNVFWTHNDSGNQHARVWAFRISDEDHRKHLVKHLGYVELQGASNVDWEDIAAGPGERIYVFDGGNNPPCMRSDKQIIRFVEPKIYPDAAPVALTRPFESIRFEYPDAENASNPTKKEKHRYDAECLFVHPISGDMYIVTKRDNDDRPLARVYKIEAIEASWNSKRQHVLKFVTDLSSPIMNMVTSGDIDADGRRIVLRNYLAAFEYTLPAGEPFEKIFQQRPRIHVLTLEALQVLQGEGICYTRNGRNLVTTTECRKTVPDQQFKVFRLPWLLANVHVDNIKKDWALVRWDTAQPLDSTVEYCQGTCVEIQSVSDKTEATSHTIKLTGLKPAARYHYRVQSGSLSYPTTMPAPGVSFMSAQPAQK